uniref:Uncharacterized protein n=1 Tax=Panagrolaimus sp. ES5 TaxID=591445 RepID=A0AC34FYB3_9BILA
MVDRLQYQNQAYGSPQVVPPSQQQLQPQIIIPTTTPTSAGTAAATNLPQKQAVNNPGQFRQLQQVPRFVQRGTTIRYIQQQGPRIVAVQRATSTQYIRTNVVRQLPPGVVLVRSQYQNQIYEMPQQQQQYQGQSNARPQQRIFVNNTVQYRQIQHQGGQRYFAVQNQSYGSQILQQQQQTHAQVILPSTTAAANVQEQKHSINNTVQLQHIQQQSQRTVVQLVTPKEEIPDDLIKNEVMVPEPSDENITAAGGGDGAGSTQQSTDGFMTIS